VGPTGAADTPLEDAHMKPATGLLAAIVLAVSAHAAVRLFITSSAEPYGLVERNFSCWPTRYPPGNEDCDWYHVGEFPPGDYPSGSCGQGIGLVCPGSCGGPFVGGYLWFQFQNEMGGAKINGLQIVIQECGTSVPATCIYPTYYIMHNSANGGYERWDGTATPPYFPEWHHNPQTMIAITAHGLRNWAYDEPCNLYDGDTRTALLAAIVCDPTNGHPRDLEARITNISGVPPPGPPGDIDVAAFFSLYDRGDLNCDGSIDFDDINPFVLILTDPALWVATYPDCPFVVGDINADGTVDFADINPFVALFSGP
jgi:hypothetical protein